MSDVLDYEAAPARNRVRFLALGIFAVLMLLAGRAVQLAFSGDPLASPRGVVIAHMSARPPPAAIIAKMNERKKPQSKRRLFFSSGTASANWKKTEKLPY